ncbi:MAG: ATP-binding cassette domain-containing protein [Acidimicrobiales bacterium]
MNTIVSLRAVRVELGETVALDGVNLDIGAGERVALVGRSGAGKTTLLRLCNATIAAAAGSVRVFGEEIQDATDAELRLLRRRIGTVHQQLNLVGSLRVVHNVNAGHLGTWSRRRALGSLIRPRQIDDAIDALEQVGIADKLHERTDRLSGGEQQRVALARVLVQRPELVLADEPVSSLDPARADEVVSLLCDVVAGRDRALLVSLHDFELARRRCQRVIGMRAGRIVFDVAAAAVTDAMGEALYRIDR